MKNEPATALALRPLAPNTEPDSSYMDDAFLPAVMSSLVVCRRSFLEYHIDMVLLHLYLYNTL